VRIALDPKELHAHPLRVGLSVNVSVDVRDTSGSAMDSSAPSRTMRGDAGDGGGAQVDALIRRILRQNGA
jgi:membrane fusion protein (multidrug efflux system)